MSHHHGHNGPLSLSERADALEEEKMHEMERIITKSTIGYLMEGQVTYDTAPGMKAKHPGKFFLMGEDPRLPRMPEKPTLVDYFRNRFASTAHLLQSANHALKGGQPEKVVLACLLHDIAVVSFIRCDHGYWGAQMIEPYVDEEIAWAMKTHQALRFFPDELVGYGYPDLYKGFFGPDYRPENYIVDEYQRARKHKWYMTSRLICLNDIYSFDPNAKVELDDFVDIIGRNFRQPKEGLGLDSSPSAHMWRTILWPTRFCHENRLRPALAAHRARPAEFLYRPLGAAPEPEAARAGPRAICQRHGAAAHGARRLSALAASRMPASGRSTRAKPRRRRA